jgi:hypothetical protein
MAAASVRSINWDAAGASVDAILRQNIRAQAGYVEQRLHPSNI